ncbi:MAG: SDR family NAD(P)-dependent oxidoreductase, partial [Sciscionella sp.]
MTGNVLVTGAGSGIGAAAAAWFAAEGWSVTGVDIRETQLQRALAGLSGTTEAVVADLADPRAPEQVVRDSWARTGPLDVIVNAAGIYPARGYLDLDVDIWDQVQAVNVRAPMLTTRVFGELCIAAGRTGSVVNISSGAALRARHGAAHYCTSKAALEMLTKSAAVELGA